MLMLELSAALLLDSSVAAAPCRDMMAVRAVDRMTEKGADPLGHFLADNVFELTGLIGGFSRR